MKLEVCCGSYLDAYNAYLGNADRVELCSGLYLGGLTPSLGSYLLTRENTNLEIVCILRPRPGGFCYEKEDIDTIFRDAKIFLDNGVDGLVFGFLTKDHKLDIPLMKDMINLIKSYNKKAILHRAFDCLKDPIIGINEAINLGIDRILTSGQQDNALLGIDLISKLEKEYGNKIEILAGCGINTNNVLEIINKSNIKQIHSSCKGYNYDNTNIGNTVSYAYLKDNKAYETVDTNTVKTMIKLIKEKTI